MAKKIINGRKYDTETAKLVGEWANMHYVTDLNYESESLYVKRNGEYFLLGEGNARSRYAKPCGDGNWIGAWEITPLTYDAARRWAEEHLDADEYEAVFGEVSEDEAEDVVLSVRISSTAATALARLAARTGRSKGDIVAQGIIAQYTKRA